MQRRTLASVLVALSLSIDVGNAQGQTALDAIMAKKQINIAVPTDYPLYGCVGSDMAPQGLDIEMARLIGAKLGAKVELVPFPSANRIPYLQTKKTELIISNLGKNPDREKVIDFSAAYAPFYQAVFGPKTLNIKAWGDLSGKSVAVTRGAMEDQELAKVAPTDLQVRRFEDNNATISAFVSGQTQLLAASAAVAGAVIQKNPQISAEYKLLLKDSPFFIGINKGEPALLAKVNAIIAALKKDGTLEAMAKNWLGRGAGELPL